MITEQNTKPDCVDNVACCYRCRGKPMYVFRKKCSYPAIINALFFTGKNCLYECRSRCPTGNCPVTPACSRRVFYNRDGTAILINHVSYGMNGFGNRNTAGHRLVLQPERPDYDQKASI